MSTIYDLLVGLGLDTTKYKAGMDQATVDGRAGANKIASSFTELKSKIDLVGGALRTAGEIARTVFEWGEQGAAITQTAESFNTLLGQLGVTRDVLDEMSAATRGTVAEMDLMASSTSFLKGVTGEMGTEFANALPEIARIAQAAHDLNPTMGTTTELVDRLARGIRKAEPELLDEMGIVVKLDQVFSDYAASLGKSADELTANERSMAVLNTTLNAGQVLVEQAGGTTTDTADAYAQLRVAVTDATNEFKQSLAPAVADVAAALTDLLNGYRELTGGVQKQIDAIAEEKTSWDEYYPAVKAVLEAKGFLVSESDGFITVMKREGQRAHEVTDDFNLMNRAVMDAANTQGVYADGSQRAAAVNRIIAETTQDTTAAVEAQAQAEKERLEAFRKTSQALQAMTVDMALSGKVTESWAKYHDSINAARQQNADLNAELQKLVAEGIEPTDAEFISLTGKINDNVRAQQELLSATNKATKELIFQKVSASMTDQAALSLARRLGLVSEMDYELFSSAANLVIAHDANRDGVLELSETYGEMEDQVAALVEKYQLADDTIGGFTGSLGDYQAQAAAAAAETQRLANVQAALDAGIAGQLQNTMNTYKETIAQTSAENQKLIDEYWQMIDAGTASGEQWVELSQRIDENNARQAEALATMREATAQLIYQQASQGLTADAALILARELGVMSEEDYNLVVSLQELKTQFDINRDGMIDATEAANGYAAAVRDIMNATIEYQNLVSGGGNGYVGNGIYIGGPGETIGPGATTTTTTNNYNSWNVNATYPPGSGANVAADLRLFAMAQGRTS